MEGSALDALDELLCGHGARLDQAGGWPAIADYGDPAAERRALVDGCALHVVAGDRRRMTGADRHRFLNGLVTCDVKELAPGHSVYGLVTNREGKILADLTVVALADELWLELPSGRGEAIDQHLRRYRVADRVEIEPHPTGSTVALLGPRAEGVLAELVGERPPALGEHLETMIGPLAVRLDHRRWLGFDAFVLWVAETDAVALLSALLALPSVQPVGRSAFDAARVAQGAPRYGADYGEDCLPQETGLEAQTVSYTKGCYLGQEVIARIHYRGGVQRGLVGVRSSGVAPTSADELLLDGRAVGRLGSVIETPPGGWIALAIIHQRGAAPGTELSVAGGGVAVVEALPFST